MFTRYAKAEVKTVVAVTVLSAAAILFACLWQNWLWGLVLLVGPVGLGILGLQFFRDPDRQVPDGENRVVSPADGVVMDVKEGLEHPFVGRARRLGIFMSLFNVHVNRVPVGGEVAHTLYRPGEFLRANLEEASERNESYEVGLRTRWGKVLVRQVAGIVARRIVCEAKKGQNLKRGERYGMVKYGSRLEVWVEEGARFRWCVKVGDRTRAGETVIGEFLDEA
ncbi:MAG: phosphatidylserine decarboxylase family protein [Planctomycetota bacterium]|nr:MAG: phosphatidylserine decarboxylase family protein [Planctomycetota bacterium]